MRELLRGTAVVWVLRAIAAGLEFVFHVVLARLLGAEGSGAYFLAFTVMMIGSVFGRLGLDNAIVRHGAAAASAQDWKSVKGVYQKGMTLAVVASLCMTLVIVALAPWLAENLFGEAQLTRPLRLMALAITPISLVNLHGEMLKSLKHMFASQLIYGVSVPAVSIGLLVGFATIWGVLGAVSAYLIATVTTATVGWWLWRRATPQLRPVRGTFPTRDLLRSSMPLFWVKPLTMANVWIPVFLLGIWASPADVGVFSAAARTGLLCALALISVESIAAPKFAAFYRQRDVSNLSKTARRSTLLIIALASPVFLLFFVAPDLVMGLFGEEFIAQGSTVLIIIAVGQVFNAVTGPVSMLLMMGGYERHMRDSVAIGTVVNLVLGLVLIPWLGLLGAATATALSLAVTKLTALYFVIFRLGLSTLPVRLRRVTRTRPLRLGKGR